MPSMSKKELDKFVKDNPDSQATQAIKEQLGETADPDSTAHKQADGGVIDYSQSMSIIERNRGKQDFVLLEHEVVEANTKLIAQLHDDVQECMRIGLEKAMQIGELLFEQKKRIKHGKFTRWVAEFLPFSSRTAQNYMRLYNYKKKLWDTGVTSLSEAYAALKGEAAPDEVIDADDSVGTGGKLVIKDTGINIDNMMLPKKKAEGRVKELVVDQEVIDRIREQDFPFEHSKGKYLKIVVSVPNRNVCKSDIVGEFVLEASKLLKPGGKLIFHKK